MHNQTLSLIKKYFPLALFIFTSIILVVVYGELAEDIRQGESFSWDVPLMLYVNQFRNPWLNSIMLFITQTGGGWSGLIFILFLSWLEVNKKRKTSITAAASYLGAISINGLLKLIYRRPRPSVIPPLATVNTFSFPSGHTITAVALYGFAAFILWRKSHRILAIFVLFWACLIAFSRIYLGVHYPSDVLGAITVGSLWIQIVIITMKAFRSQNSRKSI